VDEATSGHFISEEFPYGWNQYGNFTSDGFPCGWNHIW
jgi:hypothetical protein